MAAAVLSAFFTPRFAEIRRGTSSILFGAGARLGPERVGTQNNLSGISTQPAAGRTRRATSRADASTASRERASTGRIRRELLANDDRVVVAYTLNV